MPGAFKITTPAKKIVVAQSKPFVEFTPRPADPTGTASVSVAAGAKSSPPPPVPATRNVSATHSPGGLRQTSTAPGRSATHPPGGQKSSSTYEPGGGALPPRPSFSKGHEAQGAAQRPKPATAINGVKAKPKVVKRYKVGAGPKPAATNRVSRAAAAQLAYRQSIGGGPSRRLDEKR